MGIKKWTDPITGENFVEDTLDLPLSKIGYLKYFPWLIGAIGLVIVLLFDISISLHKMRAIPVPREVCYFSLTPEATLKEHKTLVDNYIKGEIKRRKK